MSLMRGALECRKAADWIEDVVKTEGIECKFMRLDGYLFPDNDKHSTYSTLEKELKVRRLGFRV